MTETMTPPAVAENIELAGPETPIERLLATFMVGDTHFGVDALQVQEVLRHQPMTTVPLAPPDIRGLINLRGQVVTAMDLRRRLDIEGETDPTEAMNVVVRTDDGPISFLVDAIGDVLDTSGRELHPVPETLREPLRSLVTGVHQLDDDLLLVLDVKATCRPVGRSSDQGQPT